MGIRAGGDYMHRSLRGPRRQHQRQGCEPLMLMELEFSRPFRDNEVPNLVQLKTGTQLTRVGQLRHSRIGKNKLLGRFPITATSSGRIEVAKGRRRWRLAYPPDAAIGAEYRAQWRRKKRRGYNECNGCS